MGEAGILELCDLLMERGIGIEAGLLSLDDTRAPFSSWNSSWMDVAAPGAEVFATFPNHPFALGETRGRAQQYDYGNGTSMAVAHVAGLAALLWSTPAGRSNHVVRDCIEQSTDPIPGTGTFWIHGRVNAARAVAQAIDGTCGQLPTRIFLPAITDAG